MGPQNWTRAGGTPQKAFPIGLQARSLAAVIDGPGNLAFKAGAGDDAVDEAVRQQELAGLEAFGQFQADCGFDGAWAGEAYEGFGLGKNEIAQRGEAGSDAAHRGIGEDGDEQAPGFVIAA